MASNEKRNPVAERARRRLAVLEAEWILVGDHAPQNPTAPGGGNYPPIATLSAVNIGEITDLSCGAGRAWSGSSTTISFSPSAPSSNVGDMRPRVLTGTGASRLLTWPGLNVGDVLDPAIGELERVLPRAQQRNKLVRGRELRQ
jgi:hypothetical protein